MNQGIEWHCRCYHSQILQVLPSTGDGINDQDYCIAAESSIKQYRSSTEFLRHILYNASCYSFIRHVLRIAKGRRLVYNSVERVDGILVLTAC